MPLSWSLLFLLAAGGFAYYWFNLLPKIQRFETQEEIISEVIPKIGSDVSNFLEVVDRLSTVVLKINESVIKLEQGMSVALKEENEIKRIILTSRNIATPQEPVTTPQSQVSSEDIKKILQEDKGNKITDARLEKLKNALSFLEQEVEQKRETDKTNNLYKILSAY